MVPFPLVDDPFGSALQAFSEGRLPMAFFVVWLNKTYIIRNHRCDFHIVDSDLSNDIFSLYRYSPHFLKLGLSVSYIAAVSLYLSLISAREGLVELHSA